MSQVSIIDIEGNHPQIPTEFIANIGTAIPIANQLEIFGATVAPGVLPVYTTGSGNNITTNVQISQAIAASDALSVGLAAFNSSHFTVDANGFVSLVGGTVALDSIGVDANTPPGSNPVIPDGGGLITITGAQVIAGTTANVIRTNSLAANNFRIEIQRSTATLVPTIGSNGVSHFDSSDFTVDPNGFVSLSGTVGQTITGQSGGALSPTAGNWNIFGAVVAAGTSPVATSGAVSTLTVNIQTSQALAAEDATKIGLSNFDSARFTVSAAGFVSINGSGVGETITGDSGGALNPTGGNWNILGRSGSKTAGSGSTLTINSPPFSDQGSGTSVTLNSGSFSTAAITLTTPVTAGLLDGDLVEFVSTNGILVVQLAATQIGHLGNAATSAAGTFTGTATGDSLTLRYQASTNDWWATASQGNWVLA